MTWKKVNQGDSGTATKFGGNDLDKIADSFNGVDVSDPIKYSVDINTLRANTNTLGDILKNNGTKYVRFARGTNGQVLTSTATDIAWSTPAGDASVQSYNYLVYKDPGDSSYKARNGFTGAIDYSHATNVASVINQIIAAISPAGTPTTIEIGPGDFNLTTGTTAFADSEHRKYPYKGPGYGRYQSGINFQHNRQSSHL